MAIDLNGIYKRRMLENSSIGSVMEVHMHVHFYSFVSYFLKDSEMEISNVQQCTVIYIAKWKYYILQVCYRKNISFIFKASKIRILTPFVHKLGAASASYQVKHPKKFGDFRTS